MKRISLRNWFWLLPDNVIWSCLLDSLWNGGL